MAKKKILYVVEAMGGGVFTYIVDLANELVDEFVRAIEDRKEEYVENVYQDLLDNYEVNGQSERYADVYNHSMMGPGGLNVNCYFSIREAVAA